ncbi:hypothetical protein ACS0TY_011141 [Phlomoides rotata]
MFQFNHALDLRRVLDGCPWSSSRFPLIVHHISLGEIPHSVPLNKLMFWVQIFNLLASRFSESVGERLRNFIDNFLQYDESNKRDAWKNYMCIRVEIDVTLPLKRWKISKWAMECRLVLSLNTRHSTSFASSFKKSWATQRAYVTNYTTQIMKRS